MIPTPVQTRRARVGRRDCGMGRPTSIKSGYLTWQLFELANTIDRLEYGKLVEGCVKDLC